MNQNISSPIQKRLDKEDTACSYLRISGKYYLKFQTSYNSGDELDFAISFTFAYKAWDALFQSNLLFAGIPVRKSSTQYELGSVAGITDELLNPFLNSVSSLSSSAVSKTELYQSTAKWPLKELSEMLDAPHSYPLFNTLDLLRSLRNAEAHDFITNHRYKYGPNVKFSNTFMIPLMDKYIKLYEILLDEMNIYCEAESGHQKTKHKNSVYCARKSIITREELVSQTHYPLPHDCVGGAGNSGISGLLKRRIKFFKDAGRVILDNNAKNSNICNKYPYTSLSSLVKAVGLEPKQSRRVKDLLKKHTWCSESKFCLRLKDKDGKVKEFYSEDLVNVIINHKGKSHFIEKECCC